MAIAQQHGSRRAVVTALACAFGAVACSQPSSPSGEQVPDAATESDIQVKSYTQSTLPLPGAPGRLGRVTDGSRGLWMDQGKQWMSLSGGVTNVKEFGALGSGDGSGKDDTAAIQAAIDQSPVGGVVYLPPGTYPISATLWISSSLTLRGSGPATVIKFKDGLALTTVQPVIRIRPNTAELSDVVVEQLQIDGSAATTTQAGEWNHGVEVSANNMIGLTRVWIRDNYIKNVNGDGVTISGGDGSIRTTPPTDIYVTNNSIERWKDNRQGVAVICGNRVTIGHNHIFNHTGLGSGVDLEPNAIANQNITNVVVIGNAIEGDHGMAFISPAGTHVDGITVEGNLENVAVQQRYVAGAIGFRDSYTASQILNLRSLIPLASATAVCPAGSTALHVPKAYLGTDGAGMCAGNAQAAKTCSAVKFMYIQTDNTSGAYPPNDLSCATPIPSPWPWGLETATPDTLASEWIDRTFVVCCQP